MQQIHTSLTSLLGVNTPIVVPSMMYASGGKLAATVTLAGGYGFAAGGANDRAGFTRELEMARDILSTPRDASIKIGAGFMGWMLDIGGHPVDTLDVALEQRVESIWLSFGNDLGKWVDYIRKYDQSRTTTHKTLIWIVVNSVAEAEVATHKWKSDVLVVQGIEAGGHGHSEALPLVTLLPLIKQELPDSPPLVAAGGLVNGGQIAAMLVLGASGAIPGTRFVATVESIYSQNQKNAILAAKHSVRTLVFDQMRGLLVWPPGVDGRALYNKTLEDSASGVDFEVMKKRYSEAMQNDDTSRIAVWSGASVGLINEIVGAEVLTKNLHQEILTHLDLVFGMIGLERGRL